MMWMQLMHPSVQKSRITTSPRRLAIGSGAATLNHWSPGRAISGAMVSASVRAVPIAIIDAKTKDPGTIFDVRIRDLSKLYAPQWAAFRPAPLLILNEILDARTNRGRTLERRTLLAISVDRANSYQVCVAIYCVPENQHPPTHTPATTVAMMDKTDGVIGWAFWTWKRAPGSPSL